MKLVRIIALSIIATLAAAAGWAAPAHAHAETTTPYISDFSVAYYLGRDDERRSTLKVVERITVEFPLNRNKGIVREIPWVYDGHSVGLQLDSVTRGGQDEPIYRQSTQGDMMVLETGTDEYISGTQVFELRYRLRDVTRFFADTAADELYWDTNGTGWRSSISRLSVTLTMDEGLRGALSGKTACYQGLYRQSESCDMEQTATGFALTATDLAPGENVTIAVGFDQGTFAAYEPTLLERVMAVWAVVTAVTTVVGVVVLLWLSVRAYRALYRTAELGTIVPEYIPPQNASVAASAAVLPAHHATLAAQLTDLAVRYYIQIIETRAKSTWRSAQYDIKVVRDSSTLRAEEQEILSDMFGRVPAVGDSLALKTLQHNNAASMRFADNDRKLRTLMRAQYGLTHVDEPTRRWFGRASGVLLVLGLVTLAPMLLLVSLVAFVISKSLWSLSDDGLALYRYLKGLELYIKVAEKDRLKMLQSPEGAAKVPLKDTSDTAQLVKLYERVLPYAILFRQEKEWSKRLGDYYASTGSSPDWYSGKTAFNAAMFGSMMTNFSSSVSTTSASSSSSGGSSGGGFSGGGGGGGGGGFR